MDVSPTVFEILTHLDTK